MNTKAPSPSVRLPPTPPPVGEPTVNETSLMPIRIIFMVVGTPPTVCVTVICSKAKFPVSVRKPLPTFMVTLFPATRT